VRLGFGDAGELIAGLNRDADSGGAGEGGDAVELGVAALAGDGDAVETTGTGPDGLFNGMEAVENFHKVQVSQGIGGRQKSGRNVLQ
jgi:hypothetical protein